jgi:hypothetical protein
MARLADVERVIRRLRKLAGELRAEARGFGGDFKRMVETADEIGRLADDLAMTLGRIDKLLIAHLAERPPGEIEEALQDRTGAGLLDALSPRRAIGGEGGDGDMEALTKDQLYARARAAGIPGRSKMSRTQLLQALRSHRARD